jgi:type II secretory ATPase GspE/PulE/Tfp pilus assembly ATPase PilB-like protein
MIGEIRDEETAETAIKAALTGHLVLTTLHANSAAGSITRLIDMGIKPFLVGAVTRCAAAQRLVRRLCVRCRAETNLNIEQAAILGRPELAGMPLYRPVGCKYCAGSGFLGRTGLFEFAFFDAQLAQLVAEALTESELLDVLRERKTRQLLDDGIAKLRTVISPY